MRKFLLLAICCISQINYPMQKISDIHNNQNNLEQEQLSNNNILQDIQMKSNNIIFIDCSPIKFDDNNNEILVPETKKADKYNCPKCDKSYQKKFILCAHIRNHHREEKDTIYQEVSEYNIIPKTKIEKTALGQKLRNLTFSCFFHNCTIIDTYFNLIKHMKVHITNKLPYRCLTSSCNKTTHNRECLIDYHSNLLFYCALCTNDQKFFIASSHGTAIKHYRQRHLISQVSCPLGCKKLLFIDSLKSHVKGVHKDLDQTEAQNVIQQYKSKVSSKNIAQDIPADAFFVFQSN